MKNVTAGVLFAIHTYVHAPLFEFVTNVTTDHIKGGALYAEEPGSQMHTTVENVQ